MSSASYLCEATVMKRRPAVVLGGVLIAVSGAAALAAVSMRTQGASAVSDPRQEAPIVRLVMATQVAGPERRFTGVIAARVQSNLGFRVAGKIVERLVNVAQQVKAGQPLMRIDATDLRLALTAKRNAVAAARASVVQTDADKRRYDNWSAMDGSPASAMSRRKPRRIQPRRSSRRPKPKRGSPRTRRPIRFWWRTRMER